MPAGIEVYKDMAAFASLRQPAWHDLGTVFDKPVSTAEMLELAHMAGWNLRFEDASDWMPGFNFVDETFHVVRDNPFIPGQKDVLGTVGGRYNIFSNEQIFDFADTLTDGRRRWETAGSIKNGQKVFATLVATDDLVLDPNGSADTIRRYIMLVSSHDGSTTMIVKMVNTRVVCQNTLNIALGEKGAEFKIRHTQGMETKIQDAKKALGLATIYDEAFENEMQALFEKEMTLTEFEKIVMDVFPEPEEDVRGSQKKWDDKMDTILNIWQNSTGSVENLPNNAYKGLQVLTEHNQWFRGIRKSSKTGEPNTENFLAAGAGFDLKTTEFRTEVFERMKEFAMA
jgi:phage/plasmid-like protein (TIGR03299 family)